MKYFPATEGFDVRSEFAIEPALAAPLKALPSADIAQLPVLRFIQTQYPTATLRRYRRLGLLRHVRASKLVRARRVAINRLLNR